MNHRFRIPVLRLTALCAVLWLTLGPVHANDLARAEITVAAQGKPISG